MYKMYRVTTVVNGLTHIYDSSLADSDSMVGRRCDGSVVVKESNTKVVSESELKEYIRRDELCGECLRYKSGVVLD